MDTITKLCLSRSPRSVLRCRAQRSLRRPQLRREQRGMALLEALISMLIFSFGVLGLIGLEARAINFSVDAEDRNRAAIFAGEVASAMWVAGTVDMTNPTLAADKAAWNVSVAGPTIGMPKGQLFVTPVAGTTNAADIMITWRPPSRAAADPDSVLTTRVILP